ncbi:MAG: alpha/beta hydrolase, partial [Phycicoccus sp.]
TVQNAADVDDVRRALGIARWDLWGVSYGTLLAQETMRRYPDGIRRVVLDSVSPAVQPGPEGAFSSDGELTRLLTGCQLDRACRSMLPDPQAALTRVVNRYQERPRPIVIDGDAEAGVPSRRVLLTGNDVAGLFARAVGVTELQASLPHRLARLDAGDPRGLDELAQQLITPAASTDATSEFPIDVGTYLAVTCHDSSGGAGAAADREAALDIIARTPRLTRTSNIQSTALYCPDWPSGQAPASFSTPVRSDIPTLVLAGEFDYNTPVDWSRTVAEDLPRSLFVAFGSTGHVVTSTPCGQSVTESYLSSAVSTRSPVGRPDTRCVPQLGRTRFITG